MKLEANVQIDECVRPYLQEIAERLWSSTPIHAALMIGAGLSKNASSSFKSWGELSNLFFEKLHGRAPAADDNYLNAMKIAGEVEAEFGRNVLDEMIYNNLNDDEVEPSDLHKTLLELPWKDIFTTNYDRLIEKAQKYVPDRRYRVVECKEDLLHSPQPRIVKLHGSFPSRRPFIITEEDFRTYPLLCAPFVNTVQQSLLENTLCLIGFSGDDPNFLRWIGWIRDHIGRGRSSKVYLIGIFNFTSGSRKLLEERDIVVVDFGNCSGVGGCHRRALSKFLSYLKAYEPESSFHGWPTHHNLVSPSESSKPERAKKVIDLWQKDRESYPGWVVLSEERRNALWWGTEGFVDLVNSDDDLRESWCIDYLYELHWRLDRCLKPLLCIRNTENHISILEAILSVNKWCPTIDSTVGKISSECCSTGDGQSEKFNSLALVLSKYYRESGDLEHWEAWMHFLTSHTREASPEDLCRIQYESALGALFFLDFPRLLTVLDSWPKCNYRPIWNARRAGLLAEVGRVEDAYVLVQDSLSEIRGTELNSPARVGLGVYSEEAVLVLLLKLLASFRQDPSISIVPSPSEIERAKAEFVAEKVADAKVRADKERGEFGRTRAFSIEDETSNDLEAQWIELKGLRQNLWVKLA